jgi:uncharacterized membrane protein
MTTRRALLTSLAITFALFAYGVILYQALPDRVPTHWDASGHINGYGHKAIATFLMPAMMVLFTLLIPVLPKISPRNFEISTFGKTFNLLMVAVVVLFAFMQVVMLEAVQGRNVDVGRFFMAGLFLFFAAMGNFMGKVRRNFWMGVRTPWTLASERVWDQTHRAAGRLWVVTGLVCGIASLLGLPTMVGIVVLMAMALWPVVLSFLIYRKVEQSPGA